MGNNLSYNIIEFLEEPRRLHEILGNFSQLSPQQVEIELAKEQARGRIVYNREECLYSRYN